ncbi:MAG TPA: hypothetical protein VIG64_12145 [Actinomycetota bacterium]
MSARRAALICAVVAVATSGLAVVATISAQSGGVSALVRIASDDPIAPLAREIDPGFRFVEPGGHYDGSFFYAIAVDPVARGEAHGLIDRSAYRYGHVGYGWAAWVLSLGQPGLVPAALLLVGLAGVAAAAAAGSLLAARFGWSPWWGGLLVAFSPGLIFSVTADTSEPLALALMGLLLLAYLNRRWAWVAVLSACACLTKEPLIAVPVGLTLWELLRTRRGDVVPDLASRVIALGIGPVVFVAWTVYLRSRFGIWPSSQTSDLITLPPFAGWIDTLSRAADQARRGDDPMQIGTAAIAILPAVGGALVAGLVRARRLRTFFDVLFLLFAVMAFSLNWLQLLAPKDLIRLMVVAFALLPAVLVEPRIRPDATANT